MTEVEVLIVGDGPVGLAATISARAFAPEYGRIRFRDTLQDRDFATAGMVGINAPIPESPVFGVVTSQDRLEPTLLAAAGAPMRFGAEVIDLVEEAETASRATPTSSTPSPRSPAPPETSDVIADRL